MTRIYSHPNLAMVHLAKNELDDHGIEAIVRGEHAAAIVGGGIGADAWNELWLLDETREEEAVGIIKGIVQSDKS